MFSLDSITGLTPCHMSCNIRLHAFPPSLDKKTKIASVKEIFKHWSETFKASTSISCTSLMTRIAASISALDGQGVAYISTPRIDIDEHYLMQGHHLKYDDA